MSNELIEKYQEYKKVTEEGTDLIIELEKLITIERKKAEALTQTMIDETRFSQYEFEPELHKEFLKEPYFVSPVKDGIWRVAVPKFIKFSIGFYEYSTNTYNAFLVNKMAHFFGEIPLDLQDKFKFKEKMPLKIFDGMLLTGNESQEEAWNRYKKHLSKREGSDRIRIKRGHQFNLFGNLLEDGILPYFAQPITKEFLRTPKTDIQLKPFQMEAWELFKQKGAIGVYWLMGSGKTFLGLYALANIKGKKLVVVPGATLREQWIRRLKELTTIPSHEVKVVTYSLLSNTSSRLGEKIRNDEYSLVIYDECHYLPAKTYGKLSLLKTKYRIGLSATPYREDGQAWKIIALTGHPTGMNWDRLFSLGVVKKPDITLYLGKTMKDKWNKLTELLEIPIKTIVFCDSIDLGQKLSKQFEYPFVSGETNHKDRIDIIANSQISFVSRVGDQGLSLDISRVIEFDFLFGSRRQEIQRMGRTMHSGKKGQHIILMTTEEYDNHHKRVDILEHKGLRVDKVMI